VIGIVTVNWHGYEITCNLVNQILENDVPLFELIVVNNSPDEKTKFDQNPLFRDPRIRVIHAADNSGYAGGLNTGIKALLPTAHISHLLLMNNDVEIQRDFIQKMLAQGNDNNRIYAPLILLRDTELVQNMGGKLVPWLGGTININKNVPVAKVRKQQPDFLSGCVLFLHRSIIEKIGLFDETFGSYYEDVDFCLRALAVGIHLETLWDVRVRHFHSHATKSNSSYKIYLLNRNQIFFARMHMPFFPRYIFISAAILRGFLQNLVKKQLPSYFKGVKEGLEWGK